MLKIFNTLNLAISKAEMKGYIRPSFFIWLLSALFLLTATQVGLSRFSPDSWSYFELSKTIFSDEFYKFNTYRSYFSQTQSAAFPFGYPIALALTHEILGTSPINAVYLNFLLSIVSTIFIIKICKKYDISNFVTISIVATFALNPSYMDEIFSGRAMPLAILFVLLATYLIVACNSFVKFFIAGIIFGLAALVRFDFLVSAFVLLNLLLFFRDKKASYFLLVNGGFLIGILPWCIYSEIFFNKFWISDNSWVALSATPAYVLDYPAHAIATAFTDPLLFVKKVTWSLLRVLVYVIKDSLKQPLFLLSFVYVLYALRSTNAKIDKSLIIAATALLMSLFPYVLTGYVDARYFSLFFLIATFLLIKRWAMIINERKTDPANNHLLSVAFISTVSMLLFGAVFAIEVFVNNDADSLQNKKNEIAISRIHRCHKFQPNTTLIFMGASSSILPMYGAMTGNRTAFPPSNFDQMDDSEKRAYFSYLKPYHIINNAEEDFQCNK